VNTEHNNTNKTPLFNGPTLSISARCYWFIKYQNVMSLVIGFQITELSRSLSGRNCKFYCAFI